MSNSEQAVSSGQVRRSQSSTVTVSAETRFVVRDHRGWIVGSMTPEAIAAMWPVVVSTPAQAPAPLPVTASSADAERTLDLVLSALDALAERRAEGLIAALVALPPGRLSDTMQRLVARIRDVSSERDAALGELRAMFGEDAGQDARRYAYEAAQTTIAAAMTEWSADDAAARMWRERRAKASPEPSETMRGEDDTDDWRLVAEECLWRLDLIGWVTHKGLPRVRPSTDATPPAALAGLASPVMAAPLTDAEAESLLSRLSRHYRVPVMPITRYCAALRTWQRALSDRVERARARLYPGIGGVGVDAKNSAALQTPREAAWRLYRAEVDSSPKGERGSDVHRLRRYEADASETDHVFLAICKSNLLYRLLYQGEPIRTRPCPAHDGRWSGIAFTTEQACPHGCGLTGWLPETAPAIAFTGLPDAK